LESQLSAVNSRLESLASLARSLERVRVEMESIYGQLRTLKLISKTEH